MSQTPRTPEYLVELALLGELPPDKLAEVRRRLAAEPGGEARLGELDRANAQTLSELSPDAFEHEHLRRRGARILALPRRARWPLLVPALGSLVALALIFLRVPHPPSTELPESTRIKGLHPALRIHRMGRSSPEPLEPGATVRRGDRLQMSYVSAGRPFGVVISIDGRGQVTRHLPGDGGRSQPLAGGGAVALPQSYELDDAPGFERFVLVTSPQAFDVQRVLDAAALVAHGGAARTAPLPLPSEFQQTSFTLEKATP